jgi:radical SAM protein with 4Fe4S-binding SPASM domain
MDSRYRPSHLLLQWHLSERCNLRCAHCYQDDYRDAGVGLSSWLPILEQFRAFLASRSPRIRGHVTVTGGEPFAHPEFPALLERLAQGGDEFSFAILCNGTLIDEAMARRLARWAPRFVQVSVEGSPATHDALRGAGNHAVVVAALRRLVAAGVRTMISFTAHGGNYLEFSEVARLGRELKVARVWADRLIPHGAGAGLRTLSTEQTREYLEIMRQARRESESALRLPLGARTEISLHRALQFLAGGAPYRCTAGDSLITVMPDGTLYPCRRLPMNAGNLNETPLASLYDGPMLRALRDQSVVANGCEKCVYERLCRGGLRCLSYATTGSVDRADPGCWLTAAPAASAAATAPAAAAPAGPAATTTPVAVGLGLGKKALEDGKSIVGQHRKTEDGRREYRIVALAARNKHL